jgi:predicted glycoside hydrolase/deacetylase ChbG (UPF0249 family)
VLTVSADDYGYSPRYNAGIMRVARAGAIDAVGAMVLGPCCDPAPLLAAGVEIGLHIESPGEAAPAEPRRQAEHFAELFGRAPDYLDGHQHCHAMAPLDRETEDLALELGIRVRSTSSRHRDRLRSRGVDTPDLLIGRLSQSEPVLPAELAAALEGGRLDAGWTEWMVHPGYRDPAAGSSYDAGREEDLELLLRLAETPAYGRLREPTT